MNKRRQDDEILIMGPVGMIDLIQAAMLSLDEVWRGIGPDSTGSACMRGCLCLLGTALDGLTDEQNRQWQRLAAVRLAKRPRT